jgi:hypothetical protein
MAWTVNAGVRCDGILAQIESNLVAGGWTLYDAGYDIYTSINNQGVSQYLQVTIVGTYTYIQLQGFLSWNTGTHAGVSGSGTTLHRVYLGPNARGAAELVNIYMSVTTNRVIIMIDNPTTEYHCWAYFGGLGALAGANDVYCVLLVSSYEAGNVNYAGVLLCYVGGGASYWPIAYEQSIWQVMKTGDGALIIGGAISPQPQLLSTGPQIVMFPLIVYDGTQVVSFGPSVLRGDMDGFLFCPVGTAMLGHLDEVVVGPTTYLVFVPGGEPVVNVIPWTGNWVQGLAIAEA